MSNIDQNTRLRVMEQALREISLGGLTAASAAERANEALKKAGVEHMCQWPHCRCERHCHETHHGDLAAA